MSKRAAVINLISSSDEEDRPWNQREEEAASHGHLIPPPKPKSKASKKPPVKKQRVAPLSFTVGGSQGAPSLSQPPHAALISSTSQQQQQQPPPRMPKILERDSLSSSPIPLPLPLPPKMTSIRTDIGGGISTCDLPWSEKHAPVTMEALSSSVQKKKILEVRDWLEHQHPHLYKKEYCRLMILSGPSGCGKSSCIRVLASELGFSIVEWVPPAPTVWKEQKYNQGLEGAREEWGGEYLSKIDQFDEFVTRAKYKSLILEPSVPQAIQPSAAASTSAAAGGGGGGGESGSRLRTKLILIDDLPHAHDHESRKRLSESLQDLIRTCRCTVVLISTDQGSSSSSSSSSWGGGNAMTGSSKGLHKDVMSALQDVGAMVVSFNPITAANVAKVLSAVAGKEGFVLPSVGANALASIAEGDLRSALQSLQVLWQAQQKELEGGGTVSIIGKGKEKGGGKSRTTKEGKGATKKAIAAAAKESSSRPLSKRELEGIVNAQKDLSLQIFHALGKILYNKRGGGDGDGEDVDEEDEEELGPGGGRRGRGRGAGPASSSRPHAQPSAASRARTEAAQMVKGRTREQNASSSWASQWSQVLNEAAKSIRLIPYLSRPPMKYDPEYLLVQSGLDPAGALGFLHENFLQFVDEAAIEDVAQASSYLSSASQLLSSCGSRGGGGGSKAIGIDRAAFSGLEEGDAVGGGGGGGGLVEACAGSVVTRGLMFANQHPAPRRFLPLKAPSSALVNQARKVNVQALGESGIHLSMMSRGGGSAMRLIAVEFLPFLRKFSEAPSHAWINRCGAMPRRWAYIWNGAVKIVESACQDQRLGSSGGLKSVNVEVGDVQDYRSDAHDDIEDD